MGPGSEIEEVEVGKWEKNVKVEVEEDAKWRVSGVRM